MSNNERQHIQNKTIERRVLIVDDDQDFVGNLVDILEMRNYKIESAYRVNEALEIIKDFDAQVVLMDLKLPDGSGIDLLTELKQKKQDCICILLTAFAGVDSAIAALEKGAFHYLIKPANPMELIKLLDRAFETIHLREVKRQAEEELCQYVHIVSCSTDMLALMNKEFIYLAVNQAYLSAVKKTRKELIGHTASEVFGKEFFDTVIKPKAELALAGEEINYQEWFKFPAYERRFMDVTYYPNVDAKNNVQGFVVSARNITERKLAEEYILQKTALIRLQQEIALTANEASTVEEAMQICINKICTYSGWPIGHIYMLDSTGKLSPTTTWYTGNPNKFKEFRKITEGTTFSIGEGLPGSVLKDARPHWIIDVAKDPGFIRKKLIQQINVKGAFAFPVLERERVVAVLEFFSEEASEPDMLMLGTINQLATQLGRVTERKRAEEELNKSKKSLTVAQEIAHLGHWDWNIVDNTEVWSDEQFRIFGYEPDDIEPTYEHFLKALHPHDYERVVTTVKEALECSAQYKIEFRIIRPDGTERNVAAQGNVYPDTFGKPVRMFGTTLDITDRKQREEQVKASLREKEILLKEIYHRTRNNMSVICSLLSMQSKTTKDKQVLTILKGIDNRIRSMSLVHSKLYQSKDLSNINLKSYIEDLTYNLISSYQISPGKIPLKLTADDVLISIDCAIPCGLAINEIITNSLKYAFPDNREGEIKITLRLIADCGLRNADYEQSLELPKSENPARPIRPLPGGQMTGGRNPKSLPDKRQAGEMIELMIADNGIGIPEGFDLRNTKTLGLQLVVGLIENQLGGKIELNCENGVEYLIRFKEPSYGKRV